VIVCGDEPNIQALLPRIKRPVVTYGLDVSNNVRAVDVVYDRQYTRFVLALSDRRTIIFELQVPGLHNVLNALAAIGIASELDIPIEIMRDGLAEFTGVRRRFEVKGEIDGVVIVDDYAHHPTEVAITLRTARMCWPERRLVALFQPHLFTRTRDFAREFGQALSAADLILLADIYPSREQPIPGVTSELVMQAALDCGAPRPQLVGSDAIAAEVRRHLQPGDALVVMGAGSITRVAQQLAQPRS
jgi:UDP-N-acetylmuramate--alanine ligase